jgi:hypothetical protein
MIAGNARTKVSRPSCCDLDGPRLGLAARSHTQCASLNCQPPGVAAAAGPDYLLTAHDGPSTSSTPAVQVSSLLDGSVTITPDGSIGTIEAGARRRQPLGYSVILR